ncbi:MAG: hypothetical protein Q7S22_01260 [Candidatus Micrarchaeota archaeon]|nr:hypothetical protein [Candidatus Micrarchaeota archaeon]
MFEYKNLVVIILFLVAVAFTYFIFLNQEKTVDPQQFLLSIQNTSKFYVIQDLRGSDDIYRRNIMQCGIDIAGSQGLAVLNKSIIIYALEDSKCTSFEGEKTLSECSNTADGIVFYISKGDKTLFYAKKMNIGVGANYTLKSCDIKLG